MRAKFLKAGQNITPTSQLHLASTPPSKQSNKSTPSNKQNQPSHHWTTRSEFQRHNDTKSTIDKSQPLHFPRTHLQPRHSRLQLASASSKRHTHTCLQTCGLYGDDTDIFKQPTSYRLLGDDQVPTSEETSIHQSFA